MQLSAKEADGPNQIVEMHRRVCLQEGYVIGHCYVIKVFMDDDLIDWILFVSNHSAIHLSYTNYSDSVLPVLKGRGDAEDPELAEDAAESQVGVVRILQRHYPRELLFADQTLLGSF